MLFCVEMDVKIPDDIDPARLEDIKAREKLTSTKYQQSGEWVNLWRIVGKFGNISIFDVRDNERLHEILWSLPLFPFMTIRILPLATHPSALPKS
jgi:muconolactone D-isomerase